MDHMPNFLKTKKEPWTKPFSEKVAKRVSKIPTAELDRWVDGALYDVGRLFSAYQKTGEQTYLEEALLGAEALHAVIDALQKRYTRL